MSSLMQHRGAIRNGKVELLFYLVEKGEHWEKYNGPDAYDPRPDGTTFTNSVELLDLERPNGTLASVEQLYRVWRKPVGMFGCWVVFRYNGEEHVPDLSIPIATFKLPRDAKPLTREECAQYWFSS